MRNKAHDVFLNFQQMAVGIIVKNRALLERNTDLAIQSTPCAVDKKSDFISLGQDFLRARDRFLGQQNFLKLCIGNLHSVSLLDVSSVSFVCLCPSSVQ